MMLAPIAPSADCIGSFGAKDAPQDDKGSFYNKGYSYDKGYF
jgi:hypothetical protein